LKAINDRMQDYVSSVLLIFYKGIVYNRDRDI